MACDEVRAALAALTDCEETDQGTKITTQCLYPSFDPVHVFVAGYGDGYKVHDGGGAMRAAWDHGRDHTLAKRMLGRQATAYHLAVVEDAIVGEATSAEWLMSAILSVANASAAAAHAAVERIARSTEAMLKERIYTVLATTVPEASIAKGFEAPGKSGKIYTFDFGVRRASDAWLLMDAVAPHHVSISAKYVAFSDVGGPSDSVAGRFAVYDRPLEADDKALLSQVADIVPLTALKEGVKREFAA